MMIRTKLLSIFMLIVLSCDLVLGITNVYSTRFLDTNGDNSASISIAHGLFGQQRANKAINSIAQERMMPNDTVIKTFSNFALHTDDKLSSFLLQDYVSQLNNEIILTEFDIDPKSLKQYEQVISEDDSVNLANKRRTLNMEQVKKFKVYNVSYKYSDPVFDELLSKELYIYNRCSVVLLKYLPSAILDEVSTMGSAKEPDTNVRNRYTCGDLVNLYENIENMCLGGKNKDKKVVVNVASTQYDLFYYSNRVQIFGPQSSYALSVYPATVTKIAIERKHTAANPFYCLLANKRIRHYDINTRFIENNKENIGSFNYMGNFVFCGKFVNMNMLSNVLSATTLPTDKLYSILQCSCLDAINQLGNEAKTIIVTKFGVLYLEEEPLTDEEVNQIYKEIMSKRHAINATNQFKYRKDCVVYNIPPFIPLFDRSFKYQFGVSYKQLKNQGGHLIIDWYNNKFYVLDIIPNKVIDKIKYPSFSLIHMLVLECLSSTTEYSKNMKLHTS